MEKSKNLTTERNFRNLIELGLNPKKEDMDEYCAAMGDHMEGQILLPEIFDYAVSELKACNQALRLRDYGFISTRDVLSFCSSLWQISKMDVDFEKLHNQFMTILPAGGDSRNIFFFEYYLRYFKAQEDARSNGINYDGFGFYIPDEVFHKDWFAVIEYVYTFIKHVNNIIYSRIVAEQAEKYKVLEAAFECDGVKYIAKIPRTSKEIVEEAKYMRNCIASRLGEYCNFEWIYAFIRRADIPDVPFMDAVIGTGVRQELGPEFVILRNHEDVYGGPNEAIFKSWYVGMNIEDKIKELTKQNVKEHPEIAKFLNTSSL